MKTFSLIIIFLSITGCSMMDSANTISTKTYYDQSGKVQMVESTQELTDDGLYYYKSSETIIAESKNTCVPNCAPGEMANIELSRTLRAVLNKQFVDRGMNGYELADSLGTEAIHQTPLGILSWGVTKVASKPNSVSLEGDGNIYSPVEAHWTANSGEGDYSMPYNFGMPESEGFE
jgi:hypothetical protein